MATRLSPSPHKVADADQSAESGYAKWKQAKVERALVEAQDRASMIPAEKVWRDLGLEG